MKTQPFRWLACSLRASPSDATPIVAMQQVGPWVEVQAGVSRSRANATVLGHALRELGGVPVMLGDAEGDGVGQFAPDAKAVVSALSFLCSRLLETRTERRAARIIQRHWRLRRDGARQHLRWWVAAATTLQRGVRAWRERRRHSAAVVLQAVVRGFAARRATAVVRAAAAERRLATMTAAAVRLQAVARGFLVRCRRARAGLVALHQRLADAVAAADRRRAQAAIVVQAAVRGGATRAKLRAMHGAAVVMQTAVRAWLARRVRRQLLVRRAATEHAAATAVQAAARMWLARRRMLATRAAAMTVQAAVRGWLVRTQLARAQLEREMEAMEAECAEVMHVELQTWAAVALQAALRGFVARRRVATLVARRERAVLMIQVRATQSLPSSLSALLSIILLTESIAEWSAGLWARTHSACGGAIWRGGTQTVCAPPKHRRRAECARRRRRRPSRGRCGVGWRGRRWRPFTRDALRSCGCRRSHAGFWLGGASHACGTPPSRRRRRR
jgi:hypothetical protein